MSAVSMVTLKGQDEKVALGTLTILQKLYLSSILHLTLTRCNSLTVNALLSVRCYKFYLHTTYTTHMLPHGQAREEDVTA